ncbi:MAG: FAD binding domain-containing protein [Gemmatimonadota bacterium]
MLPAEFRYRAPRSVEETLEILASRDDVKLLAGGQSLVPLLKARLARPSLLVDLRNLEALRYIRVEGATIRIGALTRYRDLVEACELTGGAGVLAQAARVVGDAQVRNLGTIGGSLAHADPAADVPAAMLALDGTLLARGPQGEREIAVEDFFLGPWMTALGPDEILLEIRVPATRGSGAYEKLAQPASGFALVGVAAVVDPALDHAPVRLAVTGVGPAPVRLHGVEERLTGVELNRPTIAEACSGGGAEVSEPQSDIHASAEYRRAMTEVLAGRAILRAAGL